MNRTITLGYHRPDPPAARSRRPSLCLVLRSDEPLAPPRRFSLDDVDRVLIGRGDELAAIEQSDRNGRYLEIRIADRHVSTQHVRLRATPVGWVVEDAGSKNGTLLNGVPCMRAQLDYGDLIEAGCAFFQYESVAHGDPLEPAVGAPAAFATLSGSLAETYSKVGTIARSNLPVLLLGDSGVGKEVAARTIHELSGRTGSFIAVNCGAIAANLVESTLFGHRRGAFTGAVDHQIGVIRSAHHGTLLLDEIGELPLPAQAALLRVLQENEVSAVGETRAQPVDTRYVAATNRALDDEQRFRRDLLARVSGMVVQLPRLRDRRADLGLLIGALFRKLAPNPSTVSLTARAARALLRYDWPLNVRELQMCLRAAGELAGWGVIDLPHLAETLRAEEAAGQSAEADREQLEQLLHELDGNVAAVARRLDTSRTQVHRLLKRYGLDLDKFRK
jgi:transcriptional regulator of acetoin/glycerol metabolism